MSNIPEAEVFVFPTSFAQQRLWFLDRLTPGNPFYNVSTALRLMGWLNLTVLEQTFNEIVRRHETLRTTFPTVEGEPVQAIAPALTISIPILDLSNLPTTERETEVRRLAKIEADRPFDLAKDRLLRINLLQLDETEYVLLLNLHHIIADGWSIGVLIRELGTFYKAFLEEKPSPLPELSIQYADFTQWQREWLQGSVLETQLAYWRKQLEGISILNLPTDRSRLTIPSYKGSKQILSLSPSLSQSLKVFSQQQGVTLFVTLVAAFKTLLHRYTQQEDIAIGSPIANRNRSEIEGLIGFFVNSLVLRTDLSGNPTFLELLSRVKEVALGAYAHQDLPFEKLVEELHPERDLSRNPLFQVSFSLQNTPIEALEFPGLALSQLQFDDTPAKLDLEFNLWQDLESLKIQVIYSTDLFNYSTIARMLTYFQTLLTNIVINPEKCLSELQFLTEVERYQLLVEFSQSKIQNQKSKINRCFHQLFEERAKQTPDATALVFEDLQITYRELNNRANQIARYLQKLGVVPDTIVGICVERSINAIAGLLGIFKAGGAYLPLDSNYPLERLNFMLEDAKVSILLTHSSILPLSNGSWANLPQVVFLDKDWEIIARESQEDPASNITLENLAYIIYTSGSTGKPKGVLIQHQGLSNLAESQVKVFNLQPSDRILQFASLSFDASIFEIVMALRIGATLYLAKSESLLPGKTLIQLLQKQSITCVTLPPAILTVLPKAELPALKTIISAGESCSQDIVKLWSVDRRFFNAYGPTEVTVWATFTEIKDNNNKPHIGRPIANTQVYILDKYLQPVPIGIPGELYISGDGLARGYLNRPELTVERFIPNPFISCRDAINRVSTIYKTGDLVRYQEDGNIEFLGRIDRQVKIRGFRIELGEIEAVLRQHPEVKEVVALASDDSNNKRIIAYIVPHLHQNTTIIELRNFLKEKLPEYMIPSAFVILDSLPLNHNGKIDRPALIESFNLKSEISNQKSKVAPRNVTESAIAKIFAEVLNLESVSIQDSFFDLGGNSLLAVKLIHEINKQLDRELPLSALFLNPTVESLANNLYKETDTLSRSPLVAIQPTGLKPPFFCVHPIFGVVFPYAELAFHLGKDIPFYGLQALGIDGKSTPLTRIEDMAAYYIEALRTVQPIGPYFIGGWSFGGLVAFEMARQLLNSGQKVALLAILDTEAPVAENKPSFWSGLLFLFATAGRYIWPFLLDYFYRINLLPSNSKQQILKELVICPIMRVYQANCQAVLNYVPQTYPSRITLFKSSDRSNNQDLTMGWNQLAAQGVEIHLVPGNHLTMLRKPNVRELAEGIKFYLNSSTGRYS